MSNNNRIYINKDLELLSEKPQDLMAEVIVNRTEHFGNYLTSYIPLNENGKELIFNGWKLKELYINRQWNRSYLTNLTVSKGNMPYINLRDLIRKYKNTDWFNHGRSELELNSLMLRYAIDFLENIPEEICTYVGVDIYVAFSKVSTNQGLHDFYIKFSNSFRELTGTEVMLLNNLFIQKWKTII